MVKKNAVIKTARKEKIVSGVAYTKSQFCEILGIGETAWATMLGEGLPVRRSGRSILISGDAYVRWCDPANDLAPLIDQAS